MEAQITTAKHLLETVTKIREKYDERAKLTGENFNLLRILGKEHYENYHSAIISELLNEKGSHEQGDLFLKLFLEIIKRKIENDNLKFSISDFTNSTSTNEYNIGELKNTLTEKVIGGRLDILVQDKKQKLIIENKIGANDQEDQLLRYYNFVKGNNQFLIIYLYPKPITLTTENCNFSKDISFGIRQEVISNVLPISYSIEIKQWIEKCIKECANLPLIRETLNQYLNTINKMADQLNDDISKVIISNVDYFESAEKIKINFDTVCKLIYDKFISNLKIELNQFKLMPPEVFKDCDFDFKFDNDYDGFCFLIYVSVKGKRCDYTAEKELSNFKSFFHKNNNYSGENNSSWFVWINPNPNKKNTVQYNAYSIKDKFALSESKGDFALILKKCIELIKDFNSTALEFSAQQKQ